MGMGRSGKTDLAQSKRSLKKRTLLETPNLLNKESGGYPPFQRAPIPSKSAPTCTRRPKRQNKHVQIGAPTPSSVSSE